MLLVNSDDRSLCDSFSSRLIDSLRLYFIVGGMPGAVNALVRANFADYAQGMKRDWGYLEMFFRNLLLGEKNEMKSRYLLIGLTEDDKRKIRELSGKGKEGEEKDRKDSKKSGQKTVDCLLGLLRDCPQSTQRDMVAIVGINRSAIQRHLFNLKASGRLRRIGPDKGGHWEVVD